MAYGFVEYPTVDVVSRASTTMAISLENENGRMLLTASNNQQEGYTDGGNKTASQYVSLSVSKPIIDANGDITAIARMSAGADNMIMRESSKLSLGANTADNLTVNGAEITVPKGYYPNEVKKSVATASRGVPTIGVNRITRKITARVSQSAGYVSYGVENAEVDIPSELVDISSITKTSDDVTVSGAEVTTPAGYYPTEVKKSVTTAKIASPTITASADDEESEIYVNAYTNQPSGYTNGGLSAVVGKAIKLKIEGDTAVMYDSADESKQIRRKVGASIATCTVNITFSTNAGNTLISATTFANGAISTVNHTFYNNNSGQSISIQNVVCGSALSINAQYMVGLYWSGSKKDHTSLLGGTITVPNTSGTYSVEIGVVDD